MVSKFKFNGNNKKTVVNQQLSNHQQASLITLLKHYLASKIPSKKKSIATDNAANKQPTDIEITHIAVILDDTVQEVLRAQNRLAALLLSDPTFVEFDPKVGYPKIGQTRVYNGKIDLTDGDVDEETHN